jgi:hypothetical protein
MMNLKDIDMNDLRNRCEENLGPAHPLEDPEKNRINCNFL